MHAETRMDVKKRWSQAFFSVGRWEAVGTKWDTEVPPEYWEIIFHRRDNKTLAQVTQRDCELCLLGNVQKPLDMVLGTWLFLVLLEDRELDHMNSRDPFQPFSAILWVYDTVISITTDTLLNVHKHFPISKSPHLLHSHTVMCSSLLHFENVSFVHFSFLARWFLYHNSHLCCRRHKVQKCLGCSLKFKYPTPVRKVSCGPCAYPGLGLHALEPQPAGVQWLAMGREMFQAVEMPLSVTQGVTPAVLFLTMPNWPDCCSDLTPPLQGCSPSPQYHAPFLLGSKVQKLLSNLLV